MFQTPWGPVKESIFPLHTEVGNRVGTGVQSTLQIVSRSGLTRTVSLQAPCLYPKVKRENVELGDIRFPLVPPRPRIFSSLVCRKTGR